MIDIYFFTSCPWNRIKHKHTQSVENVVVAHIEFLYIYKTVSMQWFLNPLWGKKLYSVSIRLHINCICIYIFRHVYNFRSFQIEKFSCQELISRWRQFQWVERQPKFKYGNGYFTLAGNVFGLSIYHLSHFGDVATGSCCRLLCNNIWPYQLYSLTVNKYVL